MTFITTPLPRPLRGATAPRHGLRLRAGDAETSSSRRDLACRRPCATLPCGERDSILVIQPIHRKAFETALVGLRGEAQSSFQRSVVVASRGEGPKGSSRWRKPLKGSRSALRTCPTGRCAPLARESAGRKKQLGIRCGKSMRMDRLHPRMVVASGHLAISLALRGPSKVTLDRAPRRNVTSVLSGTYEAAKSGNRLRRFLFGRFSFPVGRR